MLTLFKCVFVYGWRLVMMDTMFYNPNCNEENYEYCGSMLNSYIFFISLMITCKLVILNLFVLSLVE